MPDRETSGNGWTRWGKDETGIALVIALSLLVAMSLLGALYVALSATENRIAVNESLSAKALMMAETGWNVAYREFANVNFHDYTHNADLTYPANDPLTWITVPNVVVDNAENNSLRDERNNGDYVWEWQPGDPYLSLSGTSLPEAFRFKVYPRTDTAGEDEFYIESTGYVGNASRTIRVGVFKESGYKYALFSNGDMGEFTRGRDQTIGGRIHANGDICFRPEAGQTLSIVTESMTCTGDMIRSRDIWGRIAPAGAVVQIKDGDGVWQEMDPGASGTAFDSENANWTNADSTDGIEGAIEKWDGLVRDGQLGAEYAKPLSTRALAPGGYFERQSSIRLYAGDFQTNASGVDISEAMGDAVQEVTFWNPSLDMYVTVQEIDVAALVDAGHFPSNGLLFADQPIRLINADELAAPLTVVASSSVYTKGDFNSVDKKAASILSAGRVWHVSANWSDDEYYTRGPTSRRQATNGTTIVNAAVVDGVPVVNEANWADLDGDGSPDGYSGDCWANADYLLETWGSERVLMKRGSVVHLQGADMADDPDTNILDEPGEIAWQRHSAYLPPVRDYAYDYDFEDSWNQPPYALYVAKVFWWEEVVP